MIFVTGGTGLVGSHLLFDLVKKGQSVRALKRTSSNVLNVKKLFCFYSPEGKTLFDQIEWVEGDILDIYSLLDALENVSYVYHCAAMVSFIANDTDTLIKTNVEGTANLVNACLEKQIKKLCFVSSVAALGTSENGAVFTEKLVWKSSPEHSMYAISKYGAEREVWRGSEEGLNVVIVNPSVIIGPGNWNKGSSLLFKQFYAGMLFYTNGTTGFVDVRDVVKAMVQLTESTINNERYIVSAANLSYLAFFKEMAKAFSKRAPLINAPPFLTAIAWRLEAVKNKLFGTEPRLTREIKRAIHQQRSYSSDKLIKALKFEFINFSYTVRHTADLYIKERLK